MVQFEVAESHQVLKVETVETPNQTVIVKTPYCWDTKLVILGNNTTTVGTSLPLVCAYYDWQGNALPNENRPIHIEDSTGKQIILTPQDGRAEFNFNSNSPGKVKIRAFAEFPCDPAEIEIMVNE